MNLNTNGCILRSTPITPSEASASETKEKQKLLGLAPSELKSSEGERLPLLKGDLLDFFLVTLC